MANSGVIDNDKFDDRFGEPILKSIVSDWYDRFLNSRFARQFARKTKRAILYTRK
jgi:hypothetical protein